jgi:TolB protein
MKIPKQLSRLKTRILLGLFLTTGMMGVPKPTQATFAGANGKIAFVVQELSGDAYATFAQNSLYLVNPDGSGQQQLLPPSTSSFYSPAWSPDGTKIAFTKDKAIWVMNANGTNQVKIIDVPGGTDRPAWSPDGTKLVFSKYIDPSDGSKGINLYIVNADGTGLRQLTNNASTTATDGKPTWSPDGTKIAFVRYPTATGATAIPKIYVINVDGSGVRQLSDNDSNNYDVDPDWSPDGSKIVFERDYQGYDFQATVVIMNADGSNVNSLFPGNDPAWSPDGTKIVYTGLTNNAIYIINPDGTGQTLVANLTGEKGTFEFVPAWQPLPNGTPSPTPTPSDTTPPTSPTNLSATKDALNVTLTWKASTDEGGSGVANYEIWRSTSGTSGSFSKVTTTTNTTYTDVVSKGNYSYYVVAVDNAGNRSNPSNTVKVRVR